MTIGPGIVAVRAVAPEPFANAGVTPRLAARPHDRDELCEIVRAATRDGLTIVPWGGGSGSEGSSMPPYDLALDLSGLDPYGNLRPRRTFQTNPIAITNPIWIDHDGNGWNAPLVLAKPAHEHPTHPDLRNAFANMPEAP